MNSKTEAQTFNAEYKERGEDREQDKMWVIKQQVKYSVD